MSAVRDSLASLSDPPRVTAPHAPRLAAMSNIDMSLDDIIKHPMDLATLEGLLVSGAIETPDQFVAEMRTIFRNSYVYNRPGSGDLVYESAEKLSLSFEKELLKM